MGDTPKKAKSNFEIAFDQMVNDAHLMGVRFAPQDETKKRGLETPEATAAREKAEEARETAAITALREKARKAVGDLESVDPLRQDQGEKSLLDIKGLIAKQAVKILAAQNIDEGTVMAGVDKAYQEQMDNNAGGLAGARIANGLIGVKAAAQADKATQVRAHKLLQDVPLPDLEWRMPDAAKETVRMLAQIAESAAALDKDKSGTLSARELQDGGLPVTGTASVPVSEFRQSFNAAAERFRKADTNKDGKTTKEEFIAAVADAERVLAPATTIPKAQPAANTKASSRR